MKQRNLTYYILALVFLFSCSDKDEADPINNTSNGELGRVGNTWNVKVAGDYDLSTKIIEKEGDVYTLEVTYAKFLSKNLKFGMNGNTIVDYVYGNGDLSKPFTMVKFDADIGDEYTANIDGKYHYRQVVEIETYHVPCLGKDLEMIGVYEEIPEGIPNSYFGLKISSIVWYWHPEFGLVCVEFYTDEGDFYTVEFVQIDL
jgi:hypothetical protein